MCLLPDTATGPAFRRGAFFLSRLAAGLIFSAMARTKTKSGGRPTEYGDRVLDLMEMFPEEKSGTVAELAHHLGVSRRTVNSWMSQHDAFLQAVMRVRARADERVQSAMFERALGYDRSLREQRVDKDGCVHDLSKDVHIPADPQVGRWWLQNRDPERWSDRKTVEVTGTFAEMLEKFAREEDPAEK